MIDRQSTEFKRAIELLALAEHKIKSLERVLSPNPRFQSHFPQYTFMLTEAIRNVFLESNNSQEAPKFIPPKGVNLPDDRYINAAREFTTLCSTILG